jgi:hypothetical protein
MKKIVYATLAISAVLTGLVALTPSTTASAKTKLYTNSKTLRNHKYWYSYQNAYSGKWRYQRLHFTKHSVFIASKTKRHAKWQQRHITAKHYYFRKHGSWFTFGTNGSDDVYHVKAGWANLNGHRHWTLGEFDSSNDHGGYGQAPYNVWTYTTYMNNKGWHSTINHRPNF